MYMYMYMGIYTHDCTCTCSLTKHFPALRAHEGIRLINRRGSASLDLVYVCMYLDDDSSYGKQPWAESGRVSPHWRLCVSPLLLLFTL